MGIFEFGQFMQNSFLQLNPFTKVFRESRQRLDKRTY